MRSHGSALEYLLAILLRQALGGTILTDSISSHSIRNPTSARISVPSYVKPASPDRSSMSEQVWRADLLVTEPYWMGEPLLPVHVMSDGVSDVARGSTADSSRMVARSEQPLS